MKLLVITMHVLHIFIQHRRHSDVFLNLNHVIVIRFLGNSKAQDNIRQTSSGINYFITLPFPSLLGVPCSSRKLFA